jgi:CheY-like chemotaxis protein
MNAQDAITAGGELTIITANVELDQVAAAEIQLSPGPYVRVGLSISRGEFSAPAKVREIIQQARGAISVQRTPEGGSAVDMLLPRTAEAAPMQAPRSRPSSRKEARQTILIVDDEPAQREAIRGILEDAGYEVLEASDGKEAEATLALYHVDLMITDIVMPEQEGLETIKSVRRKHPGIKIIAMSTEPAGHYLHAAKLLGAQSAMDKPLTGEVLLAAVAREIGHPPRG